ncbi:hypothetical protein [Tomato twisted leaf virus]|uniref:Uncharacterized protein n=1 Tax=Tomato twisted leaf virus TaxID=2571287 RepID=A0A4D6T3I8_9GEMI|nr:hypothetical protein KM685_gp1 [Tomato twisted leaf virus]QCG75872.1 hypothetical protein [Tomato twisted leaf virus]
MRERLWSLDIMTWSLSCGPIKEMTLSLCHFNSKCLSGMPHGALLRGPQRSLALLLSRLVVVWALRQLLGLTGPCTGSPGSTELGDHLTSPRDVKAHVRFSLLSSVTISLMLGR